jgi:DUF1365 family protein
MESGLFEGKLRHRRFSTPARSFTYSLFMVYLDLSELESVFRGRWLWSASGPNLAWFRRSDHYARVGGDPSVPLDVAIRDLVTERTGHEPKGPIRLLTHLRYLGHCFNPVSFYYCFARDGRTLETIVAEVANTPWNERHMYVLPEAENRAHGDRKHYVFDKAFHVSPFLGMDMAYGWRFGTPPDHDGGRLWVGMENRRGGERVFDATLLLARRPITGPELARVLLLRPAMTLQVVGAIYSQALRLWLKRAPFHSHPTTLASRQA